MNWTTSNPRNLLSFLEGEARAQRTSDLRRVGDEILFPSITHRPPRSLVRKAELTAIVLERVKDLANRNQQDRSFLRHITR